MCSISVWLNENWTENQCQNCPFGLWICCIKICPSKNEGGLAYHYVPYKNTLGLESVHTPKKFIQTRRTLFCFWSRLDNNQGGCEHFRAQVYVLLCWIIQFCIPQMAPFFLQNYVLFVDENILVDGKVLQLYLFSSATFMKYI